MEKDKKIAIIIGAGPAGLTAAYKLLQDSDIHPIVLEASQEIGGISKTVQYKNNRIDIGGHRFFSKDDEINDLWHEIMPLQGSPSKDDISLDRKIPLAENGPDPEKEDNVILIRHRISRIFYDKKFFDYPVSMKPETFKNMGFRKTMKAGFGYIGSTLHKRKEDNLENFYINRFGKPLYQMFFEKYTEKLWGRHPSEIDASWGAQRVKGLSLMKTLTNALTKPFRKNSKKVETSLIEQFEYPKKGPGQLYEKMADDVIKMGGEVIKGKNVIKINVKEGKIVSVECDDGSIYEGDYFISSMPLKDLAEAMGEETTGKEIYDIATGLVYRDFMTVGLLLKKLKITNKTKVKSVNNIIPDTWIYVQDGSVNFGRIQIFNNWSPYMLDDYQNHIWMGLEYFVNEGDENWTRPDDEMVQLAADELIKVDMLESKDDVLDATVVRVKKAYPAYFDTYKDIDKLKAFLNTIDNLYCVGRNGQHRYNNMDHSMKTSILSVQAILGKNVSKDDIWNVNTEKSYHEEKDAKKE